MAMKLSKPFAVATEGNTVDGRNISREQITQMAKNYDPAVYTAVCNFEHWINAAPDSMFSSQGRVVSLSTQEAEIFGQKRLQLTAVVEVPESIAALQADWKKAFSSIEMYPNFANTNTAYMSGLAFTDSPASLGTQPIKFSKTPAPGGEVYSFPQQIQVEFTGAENPAANPEKTLLSELLAKFQAVFSSKTDAPATPPAAPKTDLVAATPEQLNQFSTVVATQLSEFKTQLDGLKSEFGELKTALSKQPAENNPSRPPATGATDYQKTDC